MTVKVLNQKENQEILLPNQNEVEKNLEMKEYIIRKHTGLPRAAKFNKIAPKKDGKNIQLMRSKRLINDYIAEKLQT